jgi:integrase
MIMKSASRVQAQFGKTDARYWKSRLVKGEGRNFYGVQIQHAGERHFIALGSANKDEAAARAVKYFLEIKALGWEPVIEKLHPSPKKKIATVGEYLRQAEQVAKIEARTLNEYEKCFRRVVAEVMEIDGGGRYDWRTGKHEVWLRRVESVRLDKLTPQKIHAWLKRSLVDFENDPARLRARKNTLNGVIRNVKSVFGRKILPFVEETLVVPDPHPFKEISPFPRQSMRYRSKINPVTVIEKAIEELATPRALSEAEWQKYAARYIEVMTAARAKRGGKGIFVISDERLETLRVEAERLHADREVSRREQWKIFALALFAGLRFDEIDKLLWEQVDFERALIRIDYTPYFRPKTEDAAGDVPVDEELLAMMRAWKAKAKSPFVIEAGRPPRPGAAYLAYRARTHQKHLLEWLRELEIDGTRPLEDVQKPIHELRKEAGSLINDRHGILAASRFLRHSDTRITAAHYVDQRQRVSTGLSELLRPGNVVGFDQGGASHPKEKASGA